MAVLATLFGMLGRFAGKLLTTTLGWASILLFGRVPQDRQVVLALVTFGSVVWAVAVVGVVLPYVGAFLLAAVPAPALIGENVLRLAMLVAALLLPAVVGAATIFVVEPALRPKGRAIAEQVLRGYLLSPALAVTLIVLALVGVARFVHHLAMRWSDAHIPIVIRPGGYERVLVDLERALDDAGLAVQRRAGPSPPPARWPGPGALPGTRVCSLVPRRAPSSRCPTTNGKSSIGSGSRWSVTSSRATDRARRFPAAGRTPWPRSTLGRVTASAIDCRAGSRARLPRSVWRWWRSTSSWPSSIAAGVPDRADCPSIVQPGCPA